MSKAIAVLTGRLSDGLRAASATRCDKWAERYRIMGPPIPGPFTFKYHPWLRAMHTSRCPHNTGQKSAQMGYTEVLLNVSMFTNDILKRDVLYVLPSQTPDASNFSAARFGPALILSPYLAGLYTDSNATGFKSTGVNCIYIRGSRSDSGLKSVPAGLVCLDEVAEMSEAAISLVEERLSGQFEDQRQMWQISTPTVPGKNINFSFELSSQNHWFFKCPHCSRRIELKYPESFILRGQDANDPDTALSEIICYECKHSLSHADKHIYLQTGEHVPKYPDRVSYHQGWHINQLYSSTISPGTFARTVHLARINLAKEQELYNSKLGLPKVVAGGQLKDEDILQCVGGHDMDDKLVKRPPCVMGIDVGKILNYSITHYKERANVLSIDINDRCLAFPVKAGTVDEFEQLDELIQIYEPKIIVVDHQPETRKAQELCDRWPGICFMCHYGNNAVKRQITIQENMVTVDRTNWIDLVMSRYRKQSINIPRNMPVEWSEHHKSLVRIYKEDKDGNYTGKYERIADDHYAHTAVYCEIALKLAMNLGQATALTSRIL